MRDTKTVLFAFALFGAGLAIGQAQDSDPDFLLKIDAPAGQTTVECVSGCSFIGAMDLDNPNAGRMAVYEYGCQGDNIERCSAKVAGWIVR